ncbi:MAG: aldo/keto reductase [Microcoleaceae cyanobacterium]
MRNRTHADILNYCKEQNIAFIPYGSLDAHPLKQGSPLANAGGDLQKIGEQYGVKPNQVALAWLLHFDPNILSIPGTTSITHLEENIASIAINLKLDEWDRLNQINPTS